MISNDSPRVLRSRGTLRWVATLIVVLLLPPFIALAVVPMLLMLAPVALIGIPFIVPAMLSGSLAARSDARQRATLRPMPHALRVLH